jgi:hypothetical protein
MSDLNEPVQGAKRVFLRVGEASVDVYEDSYEKGEGNFVNSYNLSSVEKQTFESAKDLMEAINDFMGIDAKPADYSVTKGEGQGQAFWLRTDVQQDADSTAPSQGQIEEWKRGELMLYNASVSVSVEAYEVSPMSDSDVEDLFLASGFTEWS